MTPNHLRYSGFLRQKTTNSSSIKKKSKQHLILSHDKAVT